MKYFETLPQITDVDTNNNLFTLINLVTRADLTKKLRENINLYYEYSIQDGDTPEIIAHKYYGDQNRYWIIMMMNNLLDSEWDWPLSSREFNIYINDKYSTIASQQEPPMTVFEYTNNTIHHYEKYISTIDSLTKYETTKNMIIDKDTYDSIVEETKYLDTPGSGTMNWKITKKIVSIYDYELAKNESKRVIKLIKSQYANTMEKQLQSVMGT